MPLTTTHALVPVAIAIAAGKTPIRWKLVLAAALAAAAPDLDALTYHFGGDCDFYTPAHSRASLPSLIVQLCSTRDSRGLSPDQRVSPARRWTAPKRWAVTDPVAVPA